MATTSKDPKLTRKQEAFVEAIIKQPSISSTQAAIKAGYSPKTASVIASENLRKPNIVSKLGKYNNMVENTLLSAVRDYKKSEKISERVLAVDTAKYLHDKIHGKATQKTESVGLHFTASLDNDNYAI